MKLAAFLVISLVAAVPTPKVADIVERIADGYVEEVKDVVKGSFRTVMHPTQTLKTFLAVASDPIKYYMASSKASAERAKTDKYGNIGKNLATLTLWMAPVVNNMIAAPALGRAGVEAGIAANDAVAGVAAVDSIAAINAADKVSALSDLEKVAAISTAEMTAPLVAAVGSVNNAAAIRALPLISMDKAANIGSADKVAAIGGIEKVTAIGAAKNAAPPLSTFERVAAIGAVQKVIALRTMEKVAAVGAAVGTAAADSTSQLSAVAIGSFGASELPSIVSQSTSASTLANHFSAATSLEGPRLPPGLSANDLLIGDPRKSTWPNREVKTRPPKSSVFEQSDTTVQTGKVSGALGANSDLNTSAQVAAGALLLDHQIEHARIRVTESNAERFLDEELRPKSDSKRKISSFNNDILLDEHGLEEHEALAKRQRKRLHRMNPLEQLAVRSSKTDAI